MTNRPDERKEKKGGLPPPLAGAAGRGASIKAGGGLEGAALNRPGLFSRFLGPGRSLSTALRDLSLGRISLTEVLSKAVHSPFALGLLAGLTAISVGYGIVGTFKHLSRKGTSSVLGFPYTPSGPGVPRRKTGTGDSLGMLHDANKGGLDELTPGLAVNDALLPEEGTPEGDSASNMTDGKDKPTDPNAMVAAMLEKAKNEGKEVRTAAPSGGGASSGMMMASGGSASLGGASKGADGAAGGTLRPMSAARTAMGRSGASAHGVRGQTRAMGQLKMANQLSKAAVPQSGEASNYTARQAFEGNSGEGAVPLDGNQGVSTEGGGQPTGQLDGVGPKPGVGMGDFEQTEPAGEEEEKEEVQGENVTPYQNYVDMAQALLKWGAILAALAWLLYQFSYASFIAAPIAAGMRSFAALLSQAAAVLAGAAALCGVAVMLFGQVEQGIIYTVTGSLLAVLAWNAAEDYRSGKAWHFIKGEAAKTSAPIKYHDGPTGKYKGYC
ncbi:MAG TPA: hypothetical protein DCM05_07575 [Elusimicrobia bacterium]|nr:hypothetical protein [Elusimicrobiota bacterium]